MVSNHSWKTEAYKDFQVNKLFLVFNFKLISRYRMMDGSYFLNAMILCVMIHSSLCLQVQAFSLSLNKCKKHERAALLNFKQSFTKDPMKRLSSWVGEDCCQWRGVYCDDATGNVIGLNLQSRPFYDDYQYVNCDSKSATSLTSPGLDPALADLTELSHLDLSWNDFNGSQIPGFIGSLRQLRYLNLSEAGFSGHLPPQLGSLLNLVVLDLSSTQCYTNSMSSSSLSWSSNLSKLQTLDMDGFDLSRANDTLPVLSRLSSLTMLSLAYCGLGNTHMLEFRIVNTSTSFFGNLKHLDLSNNNFKGHLTPSPIRNISSLISLSLGSNRFNGSIPLWLRTLAGLEFLDLSSNFFNGVEETSVWEITGNPCNFKHLDLKSNKIKGQILEPSAYFSSCATYKFEYLDLSSNNLGGTLPSFLGKLKMMKHLDLSHNGFQGLIPSSLAELSSLNYLALSDNQLSGAVQDFLGNFTEIEVLYLSSLNLQGTLSSIIANFSKLSILFVSCDNLNLKPIYDWRPRFQLKALNMSSCGKATVFPVWLKNQSRILGLILSDNSMSGEFPNWVWNMTNLQFLDLSYNHLTGPITNLSPNLFFLDISNNFLNGALPQHINFRSLQFLYLHNNMFSGAIPSWLSNSNIIQIDLSMNRLSGKVFEEKNGSSLLMSPSIEFIDLSENELSGKILFHNHETYLNTTMYALSLRGNRLSDQIPSELCSLTELSVIDFAENQFTGHVPPCFGSFMLKQSSYSMNPSIRETVKRRKEVMFHDESSPNIDLSRNFLTGEIPEVLTNLSNLIVLNLSYNRLTGSIPQRIGNMKALESLDLSNNQLSGTIPQSLSNLNFLESFNLSNNNLHGQIPTGNQLQTLDDPSIYTGNPDLCGLPLPNKCSLIPQTPNEGGQEGEVVDDDEGNDKIEKMWFDLVIMSGVATGFWGVVGILLFNKKWRVAYSRFVEDVMARCKCV